MTLTKQILLPLYKFKINIKANSPIEFYNFPGIAFRGGFGWMLKLQTCLEKERTDCKGCHFIQYCPYASIFESHNLGNSEIMKEATHFPHPFVMSPVVNWPGVIQIGETFDVYLSIFGESIKYFHFFVKALIALGKAGLGKKQGTFSVISIIDYNNNEILYTESDGYIGKDIQKLTIEYEDADCLSVHFLTPCCIKHNGELIKKPTVEALVKNIFRKLKIISYIYGVDSLILNRSEDYNYSAIEMIDENIDWYVTDRRSKRQDRIMKIQGFTGSIMLRGDCSTIYPILKIGEIIHVGKHTSFGCGLIRVLKM